MIIHYEVLNANEGNIPCRLPVQNGTSWNDQTWSVFSVVAITWTAVLVCITLAMYQAEMCESKWRHVRFGLEGAVVDKQVLKERKEEITSILKLVSGLQLRYIKEKVKNHDKADLLKTIMLRVAPRNSNVDTPIDFLRLLQRKFIVSRDEDSGIRIES